MSLNIVMAPSVAPIGGKLTIIENGEYNVKDYAVASVNVSGGGGETWNTVFEGSVTTVADDPAPIGTIENLSLNADIIKVTFNGTEYECNKNANESYGAPFDESTEEFDWSEYPFNLSPIIVDNPRVDLYTETAGTYTLKIEEPQSGGESDFSTAEVTISWNVSQLEELNWGNCPIIVDDLIRGNMYTDISPAIITVPLYKGKCYWEKAPRDFTLSGNIEEYYDGDGMLITGDCTITIS